METYLEEPQAVAKVASTGPREWVHHVIALLDAAVGQLDRGQAVHSTIVQAARCCVSRLIPQSRKGLQTVKGACAQFPPSVTQMHMGNTEGARHAAETDG